MWMKPKQLAEQMLFLQKHRDDQLSMPKNDEALMNSIVNHEKSTQDNNKSESEESDFIKQGSGSESINKTSNCDTMQKEAQDSTNE